MSTDVYPHGLIGGPCELCVLEKSNMKNDELEDFSDKIAEILSIDWPSSLLNTVVHLTTTGGVYLSGKVVTIWDYPMDINTEILMLLRGDDDSHVVVKLGSIASIHITEHNGKKLVKEEEEIQSEYLRDDNITKEGKEFDPHEHEEDIW